MSKTKFSYPVDMLCGKISKNSPVIHSCTASGDQITYLQGQRDLNAHPITPGEIKSSDLFARRQAAASARLKKTSETYAADMAAYRAQFDQPDGLKTFQSYIWSRVKADITE